MRLALSAFRFSARNPQLSTFDISPRLAACGHNECERKPILPHPPNVNCDMKLYSTLLGGIGILTKSCASPQVFFGSRRVAACPENFRRHYQRFEAFWTPRPTFNLENAVEPTQRRKGAETQGFRLLDTFTRWVNRLKPVFPLPISPSPRPLRPCLLASLR